MKREEFDDKYKWDLSYLCKDDEDFEKRFSLIEEKVKLVYNYKDCYFKSAEETLEFFNFEYRTQDLIGDLWLYAAAKCDEDTTNSKNKEMFSKIEKLYWEFQNTADSIENRIANLDMETIKEYINNPILKEYSNLIERLTRFKNHELTYETQKIVDKFSDGFTYEDIAYDLRNEIMDFGKITDEKGKKHKLVDKAYKEYASSNDRSVRKEAFEKLLNEYEKYQKTLSDLYSSHVSINIAKSELANYNSPLEASLIYEEIDPSVYTNLIDTVNNNLELTHKFYEVKKEMLGLNELHMYDLLAPFNVKLNNNYEYEEGLELIYKALQPLGSKYLKELKDYINRKRVDVCPNDGKVAASHCRYFVKRDPLISMNYYNTINNVGVLSHELGHAMHTCFSNKNNEYFDAGHSGFVAEIPSETNELLFYKYIVNNSNNLEEKIFSLNLLLNNMQTSLIRQTLFAEFEKKIYDLKMNGEILTNEKMCNLYYELNKKYYGHSVVVDDLVRYEWERIPHFYYNFYVYTYAVGISAANEISNKLLSNKRYYRDYLKFISSGYSDTPVNELKLAKIDVTNKKYINNMFKTFNNLSNELEETYKEYKKTK